MWKKVLLKNCSKKFQNQWTDTEKKCLFFGTERDWKTVRTVCQTTDSLIDCKRRTKNRLALEQNRSHSSLRTPVEWLPTETQYLCNAFRKSRSETGVNNTVESRYQKPIYYFIVSQHRKRLEFLIFCLINSKIYWHRFKFIKLLIS